MRGICTIMLCVLFWGCSNPSSSEESLLHKSKMSGDFLFDYEWPIFFVEACIYHEEGMLPKCGLYAYGIGTGYNALFDNVDFSKTRIYTKKDTVHSVISYVLIGNDGNDCISYERISLNARLEVVRPFGNIDLSEDASFFEKENLEMKKYEGLRWWKSVEFCMQRNNPMLIEADDDGVVEFELVDAARKHVHINYQMQVHRSKDYIVWNDEGVALKKNNPFFSFIKDSCFYENITLDSANMSEFIPVSILKKCAAQSDRVYGSFLPFVQSPPRYGGRLNKEKSYSYDEGEGPAQRTSLVYGQYIHFYSQGNRVFFYNKGGL